MIKDNKKIAVFLDSLVNSVFKILPLYEENNVGVEVYIESLLFDLYSYEDVVHTSDSAEYISIMLTLTSLKKEVVNKDSKKSVVKREVFKCINVIKNMVGKLQEGE